MSRLTATPFNKPSVFEIVRRMNSNPLTPPETEMEYTSQPPAAPQLSRSSEIANALPFPGQDGPSQTSSQTSPPAPAPSSSTETPANRFRRISALSYNHTVASIRDVRRPASKWLIVVIPPASIAQQHGSLGHTLASGPPGRLARGILAPLFPTIHGQLAAIAREFNLPSTTGICLYLHVVDGGLAFSPRVSDESWPFLWGHFFDDRSPPYPSHGLPIAGRIEFDLDLHKARWYDSWIAGGRREMIELPQSMPESRSHQSTENSPTTFTSEQAEDAPGTDHNSTQHRTTQSARHVPRKLSLLDRFETSSVRSFSRPASLHGLAPRDDTDRTVQALSPVAQEDDQPKTAKQVLERKVNSWRASSTVTAMPLAGTGQISLDPVNMPNSLLLDESPVAGEVQEVELNLDDFAWSISSAGPPSDAPSTANSLEFVRSIHLVERIEGSVCLTPTTVSSFGPPLSYPGSPVSPYRVDTPDIGLRTFDEIAVVNVRDRLLQARQQNVDRPWQHVWPYQTAEGDHDPSVAFPDVVQPWNHSWPSSTSDAGNERLPTSPPTDQPWQHVWPYTEVTNTSSLSNTHPQDVRNQYQSDMGVVGRFTTQSVRLPALYPMFDLYPAVYPCVEPYPPCVNADSHMLSQDVALVPAYPFHCIYPAVYPSFEIYPGHVNGFVDNYQAEMRLKAAYPAFDLYPAVYPHFNIYPNAHPAINASQIALEVDPRPTVLIQPNYPIFDLYPSVYPHFNIYPQAQPVLSQNSLSTVEAEIDRRPSVIVKPSYPSFDIYPSIYPYFNIYPRIDLRLGRSQSSCPEDGALLSAHKNNIEIHLQSTYPRFNLYPPVYPNFNIYPPTTHEESILQSVVCKPKYPAFNLYPAVYPYFDLFSTGCASAGELSFADVKLKAAYPCLDIYPAVYPSITIYPHVTDTQDISRRKTHSELRSEVEETWRPPLMLQTIFIPARKRTHKELHDSVFPNGPPEKASSPVAKTSPTETPKPRPITRMRSGTVLKSTTRPPIPPKPASYRLSTNMSEHDGTSSYTTSPTSSEFVLTPQSSQTSLASSVSSRLPRPRNSLTSDFIQDRGSPRVGSPFLPKRTASVASLPSQAVHEATIVERSRSANGTAQSKSLRPRDSIVLGKARAWGQIDTADLLEIDTPEPKPLLTQPLPTKTNVVNRPISKLDRSKLPFR